MKTNYESGNTTHYRKFCSLIAIYFSLFLFSCGSPAKKQVVIPSDVLPKEKMAAVVADIHIAEAETSMKPLPDSTSRGKLSFQKIFDKNQITKAQYDTSMAFYIDHPELLNEVYEIVLNELSKMQGTGGK